MNTEITSIKQNPLLDRNEAEIRIEHEGEATPANEDVKNRLAAEEDLDTEDIEVVKIHTGYGTQVSKATLKIYQELDEEEYEDKMETKEPETSGKDTETVEDVDYEEIVDGTISDAKDALKDLDNPDWDAALEAEKDNKNRKTFVEWLQGQQ